MNRLRQFLVGQATLVDWDYSIQKESFAQLRKSDIDNCKVSVMRDHTHGSNRDWRLMHRYCLHNFTCEDGTRCEA